MSSQTITVSVIIPAYTIDRMDDILRSVQSANYQSAKPLEIIIAVDHNGDLRDSLIAIVDDYADNVRVVLNDMVIGGAETRNAGIRASLGDIVAFLDDDAWAIDDWLHHLMRHYEDSNVLAVGGNTVSVWEDGRPRWFPEELDWLVGGIWKGHPDGPCEVRNLIGPNMSFRREVCDTIGYMRTELGAMPGRARAGDETEFYIRLKSMIPTGKVMYEPSAVVYHKVYPWKSTTGHLIRRSASDGYWKSRTSRSLKALSNEMLSVESSYLKFLLCKAIPGRMSRFWQNGQLLQAGAIMLSIACVGAGYVFGKLR